MQIGMIGLGRMGANMARRLIRKGHTCAVFNRSPQAVNELIKEKAIGATSLADIVKRLEKPRSDSGDGRWTIKAAIDEAVPAPVLTAALYERFSSRGEADFANKLLSAMRFQFGGHLEKTTGKQAA